MSTWECVSCGAGDQQKSYCEVCGAAQPMAGEDTALSLVLGRVCTNCDAYNDAGIETCASCGAPLADGEPSGDETAPAPDPSLVSAVAGAGAAPAAPPPAETGAVAPTLPHWMEAPSGQPLPTAFALPKVDLADIKRTAQGLMGPSPALVTGAAPAAASPPALCAKCRTPLERDDKFCRHCGTRVGAASPGLPAAVTAASPGATAAMPAFRSVALDAAGAAPQPPAAMTMVFGAVAPERTAKLVLVRGTSSFGTQWRLQEGETLIGRTTGAIVFPDDLALAAAHARLHFSGGELILEPLPSHNGAFVRVKEPTRVQPGDELVVGAQRLVVLDPGALPSARIPEEPGTRVLGSLQKPQTPIALLRVCADPRGHEVYLRCQRLLTLGRDHCDVNFARDSFVSERHAQLTRGDDGALLLEDLRSRNGTYLRAHKPVRLAHGDLVLVGDKVLRVELPQR